MRIPLYCSHSYRVGDRDLNAHFWKLFWDNGFSFTVDPKSTDLAPTVLELMMARSAGFAAIVTFRDEQRKFRCSPFVVHEHGLAVQARKPRIVLRDQRIATRYFSASGTIDIAFDAANPDRSDHEVRRALADLKDRTTLWKNNRCWQVGLALPARERVLAVELMQAAGNATVNLLHHVDDAFGLAAAVDGCDYVVVDLDHPAASRIASFLQGRATPMLKVARLGGAELPAHLLGPEPLRTEASAQDLVMYWDGADDSAFEHRLLGEINRLEADRREFLSAEEGHRYFRSLGRPTQPMFLSNARSSSHFAGDLVSALQLENMSPFHYRFNNTIGAGQRWGAQLNGIVRESKVFVALMDREYWERDWCREEYNAARRLSDEGELTIIPFFLDGHDDTRDVPDQGADLRGLSRTDQIRTAVEVLDRYFVGLEQQRVSTSAARADAPAAGDTCVDIAIVTILPEEYAAVLAQLSNVRRPTPSAAHPDLHSWQVGEIRSEQYQTPFRVVLAQSKHTNTEAANAVLNTFHAFQPLYVLVVGVAGGLGGTRLGDVVVADRICAYGYGKITDNEYVPRTEFDSTPDGSISSLASTLESRAPQWYAGVDGITTTPRIHVGPVASGDIVVDDVDYSFFAKVLESRPKAIAVEMEGAGLASAVQNLRSQLRPIGYGMIRGISDAPSGRAAEAGTEARDLTKPRASAAAAACAAHLVKHAWPVPPRGESQP